ncbi:hypothetical protein TNCV_971881 [Trichonephila clavipes]|nr:hypothetical protein TNCV_971881 [Trichonephila clavipes]
MTFYSGGLPFGCLLKRNGDNNKKKVEEEISCGFPNRIARMTDMIRHRQSVRLLSSLIEKRPSICQLRAGNQSEL